MMLALSVRFTLKDQAAAEAYDRLAAETITGIRDSEPGTIVYAVHTVDGRPLQRIHYELYRDQAAFDAHEAAPHTRRYLTERKEYLAATEVDWLTLQAGKGTDG
jgi:quinol monooxygenase YgiN